MKQHIVNIARVNLQEAHNAFAVNPSGHRWNRLLAAMYVFQYATHLDSDSVKKMENVAIGQIVTTIEDQIARRDKDAHHAINQTRGTATPEEVSSAL